MHHESLAIDCPRRHEGITTCHDAPLRLRERNVQTKRSQTRLFSSATTVTDAVGVGYSCTENISSLSVFVCACQHGKCFNPVCCYCCG